MRVSGFETTPGHSGHFCTVLHTDVKSEIKTSVWSRVQRFPIRNVNET